MNAVTQWFIGEKPEKIGVYENGTRTSKGAVVGGWFQYWNGDHFGYCETTPEAAFRFRNLRSSCQNDPWRGLAEKPE